MTNLPTEIRCSVCGEGHLVHKIIEHDVGALLDMQRVLVTNIPALVCTNCGSVSMYGSVLEQITFHLAADILQLSEIEPLEVRYLRKLVGDTQEEFAVRLGVSRATVNRWENGDRRVTGPDAYAIRSQAFFLLRARSSVIERVAPAFSETRPQARTQPRDYRIEGAALQLAG